MMQKTTEYIENKMKEYAMNIDDFEIGEEIIDSSTLFICKITDKTRNSIEVYMLKYSKKGVNSKQWFTMDKFNKTFVKIK